MSFRELELLAAVAMSSTCMYHEVALSALLSKDVVVYTNPRETCMTYLIIKVIVPTLAHLLHPI